MISEADLTRYMSRRIYSLVERNRELIEEINDLKKRIEHYEYNKEYKETKKKRNEKEPYLIIRNSKF